MSGAAPTAATGPAARRSTVGSGRALALAYGVTLARLRSPGRIVGLLLLSLTSVVAGFAVGRSATADVGDGATLVANLGLAVIVPVVSLVFGGGAIGDLREDKTLIYLWLRPMRRWPVVVGAALAALTATAPIALVPLVLGAALAGVGGGLVGATALAGAVGVVTYCSLFTVLGVLLRRHIVWGLAYVLIWEGFVALGGRGVALVAMRTYTRSIVAGLTDTSLTGAEVSVAAGIAVPLVVSALALALGSWRLANQDVD